MAMKILGSEVDPYYNLCQSLKNYRVRWFVLLVTMVFDYVSTLYFVSILGVDREANAVIAWLMACAGVYFGLFVGKLLQLITVFVFVALSYRVGNIFLLVVILMNCWAVVINIAPYR